MFKIRPISHLTPVLVLHLDAPCLDTDCFGMFIAQVHLEIGKMAYFLPCYIKEPHIKEQTCVHTHTHTHTALFFPLPFYHCSHSLDLLFVFTALPFSPPPVFSWAFFNFQQSSEITLITVTNDFYFAKCNDQLSDHVSWSINSLTIHSIFLWTTLVCVYYLVLIIYSFHLNSLMHLSI